MPMLATEANRTLTMIMSILEEDGGIEDELRVKNDVIKMGTFCIEFVSQKAGEKHAKEAGIEGGKNPALVL
jgi:hypothetical protein